MAIVEILHPELKFRLETTRLLQGLGHLPVLAVDLKDFVELHRKAKPELLLVGEAVEGASATDWVAEIRRTAPLLPVIVCLNNRNASRAIEYLKIGVSDCIAPPVTRENLGASIRKALRSGGTVVEMADLPPPEPSLFRRWRTGLILAALAVVVLTLWTWLPSRREPTRSWDLPYPHPSGMAFSPGSLWIADWYSQTVYEHERMSFKIRRVYHFSRESPVSLSVAEGALWVAVSDGWVVKHLLDEKLTVLGRYKLPGKSAVGLCYDGLYLWSLDRQQQKLRQHLLDDRLTVFQEYPYPGSTPAALACNREGLWSFDEGSAEVLTHDMTAPGMAIRRDVLEDYVSRKWRLTGLAIDQDRFWSTAEAAGGGRAVLFRHGQSLPSGKRR